MKDQFDKAIEYYARRATFSINTGDLNTASHMLDLAKQVENARCLVAAAMLEIAHESRMVGVTA